MIQELTEAEKEIGLTIEKKNDPFGVMYPPVPTSNAQDREPEAIRVPRPTVR